MHADRRAGPRGGQEIRRAAIAVGAVGDRRAGAGLAPGDAGVAGLAGVHAPVRRRRVSSPRRSAFAALVGQQPSPATGATISLWTHSALQPSPMWRSVVQGTPSSQSVGGQAPGAPGGMAVSHASPTSMRPLPQRAPGIGTPPSGSGGPGTTQGCPLQSSLTEDIWRWPAVTSTGPPRPAATVAPVLSVARTSMVTLPAAWAGRRAASVVGKVMASHRPAGSAPSMTPSAPSASRPAPRRPAGSRRRSRPAPAPPRPRGVRTRPPPAPRAAARTPGGSVSAALVSLKELLVAERRPGDVDFIPPGERDGCRARANRDADRRPEPPASPGTSGAWRRRRRGDERRFGDQPWARRARRAVLSLERGELRLDIHPIGASGALAR